MRDNEEGPSRFPKPGVGGSDPPEGARSRTFERDRAGVADEQP